MNFKEIKTFLKGQAIWVGAAFVVIAVSAVIILSFFKPPDKSVPEMEVPPVSAPPVSASPGTGLRESTGTTPPVTAPSSGGIRREEPVTPPVTLTESDEWVRTASEKLAAHPGFLSWLRIDNLIRIVTAVTVNIAEGESPRAHLGFLEIRGSFQTEERGSYLYIDPAGYARYNGISDIVASVDAGIAARLFRKLLPLFQEAYRDLGYPNRSVEPVFRAAIVTVLRTPVIEGDIPLTPAEKGINFLFADGRLQGLNDAQRHFVRMGPRNLRIIQDKLREIGQAMGIPKNRLPSPVFLRMAPAP